MREAIGVALCVIEDLSERFLLSDTAAKILLGLTYALIGVVLTTVVIC